MRQSLLRLLSASFLAAATSLSISSVFAQNAAPATPPAPAAPATSVVSTAPKTKIITLTNRAAMDTNLAARRTAGPRAMPFRATIESIDKAAKTITLKGEKHQVLSVGAQTRITKDGKAATFEDLQVGTLITGSMRQVGDKLEVASIRTGIIRAQPGTVPVPATAASGASTAAPKPAQPAATPAAPAAHATTNATPAAK
jgi:hypothetical protein